MKTPVCLLAASHGSRVAIGGFEKEIEVWDVQGGERVSAISSILDFGGQRLALDAAGEMCFAAGYERGVAAYGSEAATLLWRRTDIKDVQSVEIGAASGRLHVTTESSGVFSLDAHNGSTLEVFNNTRGVVEDVTSRAAFLDTEPPCVKLSSGRCHRIDRTTFAVLHVAFGDDSICVSEAAGGTRCFDLRDGQVRWAWDGGSGEHIVRLGYNRRASCYYGILHVIASGEKALMKLGNNGNDERLSLGTPVATEFCLHGEALVLSDGRLIATASGTLLRRLDFVRS